MKQITLFGTEIDVEKLDFKEQKKSGRKTRTMQQMYGTIPEKTCKTCKHCYYISGYNQRFYKCDIWDKCFCGSSAASDIRIKNQACKKYEERK